ncbi:hypothetical protein RP20_CCG011822 [Aedes albopictus]|nr:hypothetical protein RP20_CCG011822 [Aedes albopictus]
MLVVDEQLELIGSTNGRTNVGKDLKHGLLKLSKSMALPRRMQNKISEIPHRIDRLIQLKSLDMANNLLEKVNFTEFNGMKELNFVDLSFNRIRVISIEMIDLPKLFKLDLSQNLLKNIPRNFGKLRALDDLNLSYNKLEYVEISHFNGLTKLKVLDLQFNNLLIGSLAPAILPALEVLRLESCHLQQLDLFGIEMPKLKKLYLNDNKLEYVEWFNKEVYQGAGLNLYGDRNPWNCNWLPEMHPRVKFVRQQDRIICRRFEKNVCCVGNDYTAERKADRRWQVVKEQNREIFMVLEEQQDKVRILGANCGMIGEQLAEIENTLAKVMRAVETIAARAD